MDHRWNYSNKHSPAAPVIPMAVAGYPFEVVLDTGFEGGVLIPFALFESLGLTGSLTAERYNVVLPDSRRQVLYTAWGDVMVGGEKFRTHLHASPGIDRWLSGRQFLRSFVATLDGGDEELSLVKAGERSKAKTRGLSAASDPMDR